jgi:hypothetical protein
MSDSFVCSTLNRNLSTNHSTLPLVAIVGR